MTGTPISQRAKVRAAAKTRREVKAALRKLSFEAMASGMSVDAIAEARGVSARTVRRAIDAELSARRVDRPGRYVHLQVARLTKALRLADAALDEGELQAVGPLVRVVTALDRYHGLGPAGSRRRERDRLSAAGAGGGGEGDGGRQQERAPLLPQAEEGGRSAGADG